MHPNASAFDSAFYSGASAMRELWPRMRSKQTIVLAAAVVLFAASAWAQENDAVQSQSVATSSGSGEANDTNAANNPAHPLLTVDLQNYFAPSPEGFPGRIGNQGLLRADRRIRSSSVPTHNPADQHNCQRAGRPEYRSRGSDDLRLGAF